MSEAADRLRERLVENLKAQFQNLDSDEKTALRNRLWNMIQYAIGRHDYWENYRTRYLTLATALLTVAAAGIAILVNAKLTGPSAWAFYAGFLALGGTGVCLIWRFRAETSPQYPYRDEAKVTSWIYVYTLKPNEAWWLRSLRREKRGEVAAQYVAELEAFTKQWTVLNDWQRMQEDLEQVLILYTLQAYKRAFSRRMARILHVGTIMFLVLLGIAGLLYLLGIGDAQPEPTAFVPVSGMRPVYFDLDRYDIRSGDARILEENVKWAKGNREYVILIEGHADDRGSSEYNLALGDRRARSAMRFLVELGLYPGRIMTISYGEEQPLCSERTEECRARSRRAEFRVKVQGQ